MRQFQMTTLRYSQALGESPEGSTGAPFKRRNRKLKTKTLKTTYILLVKLQ